MPDGKPIPVWKNEQIFGWAWVDAPDWIGLKQYVWWLADGYVLRSTYINGVKTTISMHREIMGLEHGDPLEVDHVDRDPLNNRRSNLRVVTRWENEGNHDFSASSSQKIGVCFDSRLRKWKAQGSLDGAYVYLGIYETEEAAVLARIRWEQENGRVRPEEQMILNGRRTAQGDQSDPERTT